MICFCQTEVLPAASRLAEPAGTTVFWEEKGRLILSVGRKDIAMPPEIEEGVSTGRVWKTERAELHGMAKI
ncbi:hypothetical protein CO670_09195 [Rhizobium sp. J15]|nr:hypothetical protein CO670_09195 [Rhizobium sp. J15]